MVCKFLAFSSGFILVMVTFLDRLFDIPEWRMLVVVSFVAFALAIFFSVVAQAFVIDYMYPVAEMDTPKKAGITWAILLSTWASFTIGAVSLIIFALKNFIIAQWIFLKPYIRQRNDFGMKLLCLVPKDLGVEHRFFHCNVSAQDHGREIEGAYGRKIAFPMLVN